MWLLLICIKQLRAVLYLLSHAQLSSAWSSAEGTSHKRFPRGTAVPTQHSKDIICFKKCAADIFRNCSQPLYKRERVHTCKQDDKRRSAQKHGKGHFSIGDNAYYMTFKHHKCHSAACESQKVSENTYLRCRMGKGGGESFTQRSTLT